MIKILQKVGIEGTYLNIINVMYDKLTANIILSSLNLKKSSKMGNKIRMPTLATFIQYSTRSPSQSNYLRKEKS